MPISKATPLGSSELLGCTTSTPPLAKLPAHVPRPEVNGISEKLSLGLFNVAVLLLFDTKNCGIEEDFEHSAMVTDSCSFCGKVKDGGDGSLRVLKEVTLLRANCVVCAKAIVALRRHSKDSGSIERVVERSG